MNVISNNNQKLEQALAALKQVMDPEIGLNIVDLGLIYQVDFDEEGKNIYNTMTLTTQFCPMGESITDGAQTALEEAFPGYTVHNNLIFDPPWNQSLISEEGRNYLNQ